MITAAYFLENFASYFRKYPAEDKHHWVEVRNSMIVHTQGNKELAAELLIKRHPAEEEAAYAWRLDNYTCITKSVIDSAVSNLGQIFNDTGYTINPTLSQNTLDYIEQKYFDGLALMPYLNQRVTGDMIEDPNGYLVVMPEQTDNPALEGLKGVDPEEYTDEQWQIVQADNKNKKFLPEYIKCNNIWYADKGLFCYISDEKSPVYIGGEIQNEGEVYYLFDQNTIYQIYQVGEQSDNEFEWVRYWTHNIGAVPVVRLGGKGKCDYLESYFSAFVEPANETLKLFSDYTAVLSVCGFPIKEMAPLDCTAEGCGVSCRPGQILNRETNSVSDCRTCGGTGQLRITPFSTLVRPNLTALDDPTKLADQRPMLQYIAPPTDIIDYLGKAWEGMLDRAEKSINLKFTDEAQSGAAKALDRDGLYRMLNDIAANVYDSILYSLLYYFERYLNPNSDKVPSIVKPTNFQIKSESELQEDFSDFYTAGLAQNLTQELAIELADRKFTGSGLQSRKVGFLAYYDPLYCLNEAQFSQRIDTGILSKDWAVKSTMAPRALNRIIEKVGQEAFLAYSFEQIEKLVDAEIKPYLAPATPDPNAVPDAA